MFSGKIELDDSIDINYALMKQLPELKQKGLKEQYDKILDNIVEKSEFILKTDYCLLCDSVLLRCVDSLHKGEVLHLDDVTKLSHQVTRSTIYKKEKRCSSCCIIRSKPNNSTSSLVYSPQEKIMLYILVYAYLNRVTGKAFILPDNLSYISFSDINLLFNNDKLTPSKRDEYIRILDTLAEDDAKIYLGNDKDDNGNPRIYNKWFSFFQYARGYDGTVLGRFYSFGELGLSFLHETNYPIKQVAAKALSINSRNYREFEIARYLQYSVSDKAKKIFLFTIMKELYDYSNGTSYLEHYQQLTNPYDRRYMISFVKSLATVIENNKEQFSLRCYLGDEEIELFVAESVTYREKKDLAKKTLNFMKNDYPKLNIRISSKCIN